MQRNVLIELSNKTTEAMAQNLVRAFENRGIVPFVYNTEPDGRVRAVSGDLLSACDLNILSKVFPDRYRPLVRGAIGAKLLRALFTAWHPEDIDAFILFDDSSGHRRVIAEWGLKTGVPVFYIPESAGAVRTSVPMSHRSTKKQFATSLERWLFPQSCWANSIGVSAEYVCAPNEIYRSWLHDVSKRQQTMLVTGSPLYDAVSIQDIPTNPPNYDVLFIHQPMLIQSKRYREFFRAFTKIGKIDNRLNLLIKVHPRTSASEFDLIVDLTSSEAENKNISVITSGDVRDTVREVGVVVTACSTALNDALIGGVPVVLLKQVLDRDFDAYADEYGAAIAVHDPEELGGAVERALFDNETRTALREAITNEAIPKYFLGLDIKPSERIVSFVLDVINSHSAPIGS